LHNIKKTTKQSIQKQILIEHFNRSALATVYKLNCNDRFLLFNIASFMGKKDTCWPEITDLLLATGMGSKSTLYKSIKKLEQLNLIVVTRKNRSNNHYKFDHGFIDSCEQILIESCSREHNSVDNLGFSVDNYE
jgi:predicted transcriptional regulator